MATNKNALIRYRALDRCFGNTGKRYFIDDLIEACNEVLAQIDPHTDGISRRQIFQDITFMESSDGWGVDLLKLRDGKRIYYRYAQPDFSINNMPLNQAEVAQLQTAIKTLSQFKGLPQFEWMQALVPRLQQGISKLPQEQPAILFEGNEYVKNLEFLEQLFQAIVHKQVLRIVYQPFEMHETMQIELHPHVLKQYNGRWFLMGYNPEAQRHDWIMALDRMITIALQKAPFVENEPIDWTEYFEDMIGVTKPAGEVPQEVVLHVMGRTAHYIFTKPLHGSQKAKWLSPELLELRLNLLINYELERLIVSYADSMKVLAPLALQQKVAERFAAAMAIYT